MPTYGEILADIRHQIDLLELDFSGYAGLFARSDEWEEAGSATPVDWIRHHCHMNRQAASDSVKVGDHMGELAQSVGAMESGEIGFAHLAVLARTAAAVKKTRTFDEEQLLEKAKECSPGKLNFICIHYRHACDAEGFAAEQAEQIQQRSLRLNTWDNGAVTISGILDPAGGAALRNALEPLAKPNGAEDNRLLDQRMGDALVELVSGGEQKAHIQLTATVETLKGLAGAQAADLEFGFPVSGETARRLACEPGIARVLFDGESKVIDVGRTKRVVQPATRRALEQRDKGCQWPDCDRPPKRTAAHHLVHWVHGGRTDLDNLVLLCHRHHTYVHEGKWQIVRDKDGHISTVPPPMRFAVRTVEGVTA